MGVVNDPFPDDVFVMVENTWLLGLARLLLGRQEQNQRHAKGQALTVTPTKPSQMRLPFFLIQLHLSLKTKQ